MLVPLSEIEVVALRVVNFPVEAVVAPIGVLSIDPPVMVAPEEARVLAVTSPAALTVRASAPTA